jgi:16S rRNA (cytosine1402-N4)-methyltransferase
MSHVPVLLAEVLDYLNAKQGGKFIDGTVGGGGHTAAILNANKKSEVLGIDLDQTSLEKLKGELVQIGLGQRAILVSGNYRDLKQLAEDNEFEPVDGVLLDLGFSSSQVDDSTRGFSFQIDGPLDMRYDQESERTAADIVNRFPERELVQIFKEFGEEKLAKKIAFSIIKARKISPLKTTTQLAEAIRLAIPLPIRFRWNENARRIFQAIRIEVNRELENLRIALPDALKILKPGGRLVVISFHSLEDRIVKEFFNQEAKDCICPPEFPTCVCDKTPGVKILTRKPIGATEEEIKINSRSKPAKLRAAEKISKPKLKL